MKISSAVVNPVDAAVARGILKDNIPTEFPVIPGCDNAVAALQEIELPHTRGKLVVTP